MPRRRVDVALELHEVLLLPTQDVILGLQVGDERGAHGLESSFLRPVFRLLCLDHPAQRLGGIPERLPSPFNVSACQSMFLGVETDVGHWLPPGRIRAVILARRVVGRQQAYGQDRELTSSHVAPTMSATAP